jgi:ribosomal protein L16 Arg81 hydroxylase
MTPEELPVNETPTVPASKKEVQKSEREQIEALMAESRAEQEAQEAAIAAGAAEAQREMEASEEERRALANDHAAIINENNVDARQAVEALKTGEPITDVESTWVGEDGSS